MITEAQLQERAIELRRNPTEPEVRLWRHLSNSQLGGYKFRRQHVVLPAQAIVDFFCPSLGLAVEVDGDTHDPAFDAKRDQRLRTLGYATFRCSNPDVMTNMDGVLEAILLRARALPQRWITARPHPNPSPEGEGLSNQPARRQLLKPLPFRGGVGVGPYWR